MASTTLNTRSDKVPAPQTPAVQQAREALGQHLREVRREAGLTARELARRLGWQESKVSRLEYGRRPPTLDDVRAWCAECGASEHVADLIARLKTLEGMYVEWRRAVSTGLRRHQESYMDLYERSRAFKVYEPGVIPGILQTPEYAAARMARNIEFRGIPDDLEAAVVARMGRRRYLHSPRRTWSVVIEDAALWSRIGSTETLTGQLSHLISVAGMANLSLGVIPRNIERTMWSNPGFWIFDDVRVMLETPTAELTITQPGEIETYLRVFAEYAAMAVYGRAARALIERAIASLDA